MGKIDEAINMMEQVVFVQRIRIY